MSTTDDSISTAPPAMIAGAPPAAGFLRRGVAFLADLALANLLAGVVGTLGAVAQTLGSQGVAWEDLHPLAMTLRQWYFPFVCLAYFAFFTAYGGRTPGKMLLGLVVVRLDGTPVGAVRALWRTLGYAVSLAPWGIGFLMAMGPARRALHDRLSGTRVLHRGTDWA